MPKKVKFIHLIFPVIYCFILSFSVIFLSVYWIINKPSQSTALAAENDNIEIIPIITSPSNSDLQLDQIQCVNHETASKIDSYFKRNNAPLAGYGCDFVREGLTNQIDPLITAAIAQCESQGGKVTPIFGGIKSYNAWGWAVYDNNEATRKVNGYACDSWEHCIARVTRGIVRESSERSLGLTPEEIVTWYTAASVRKGGGDPSKAPWTICVNSTIQKILSQDI